MTDWADFLDGLETEDERAARRELLDRLHADGCSEDELRRAVAADRLSLLPVERLLLRERRYTKAEAVELTGLSLDYLERDHHAMGLTFARDEAAYTDENIRALRALKQMMEAGVSQREMLELTRMVGEASSKLAERVMQTLGRVLLQPGDNERDIGLRLADTANALMPALAPMLKGPLEAHLADLVKREAVGRLERERGFVPGGREVAVCFADMVGFTSLSERLSMEELGQLTEQFREIAGDLVGPPVRLVKMLGDEAMLASEDAAALVETSIAVIRAAERDPVLPDLRAGAAHGPALRHAGDFYGRPVNLAARITAIAPAGHLVASRGLADAASEEFEWAPAGRRPFKGIEGEVELMSVAAGINAS